MIEVYNNNVNVGSNVAIPFDGVSIDKGCAERLISANTINLEKCGVYMLSFNGCVAPQTGTGEISIELFKNGVSQPQAMITANGTADEFVPVSFLTLIQVKESNSGCYCSSPTQIQIVNTGVPIEITSANVCITKVC